jgi:hypothetical protein
VGADDAQQSESRRVGKDSQGSRQPFGGSLIERFGQQLRTALGIDRLDELHCRHIDDGRYFCQRIDRRRYQWKEVFPMTTLYDPCCPEESCPPGCC